MSDVFIRHTEEDDLPALLAIYNHYVLHTPVTFDIEPRTLAQRQEWFAAFKKTGRYQCLTAECAGAPIGWASSSKLKDRAAYDTSVETSIYLAPDACGQGLGRKLYQSLFDALAQEDIHRMYGGVTHPNAPSVGLHLAMGFRLYGIQTEVGRKFDKFWDVGWYERAL